MIKDKETLERYIQIFNDFNQCKFGLVWDDEPDVITFHYLHDQFMLFTAFDDAKNYVMGYLKAYEDLKRQQREFPLFFFMCKRQGPSQNPSQGPS